MTNEGLNTKQEKFFDTGKVKINYLDYGNSSREPLVMLHGGAWIWQEYLSLMPSLSQRWHPYALDLRGNGRSGWVPGRYRLEDFTEDTVAFVRQLKEPAVLIGHSIGGVVAIMVAARCPEKVKALVIEDPALSLENYKRFIDSSREMFGLWLELKRSAQSEHRHGRVGRSHLEYRLAIRNLVHRRQCQQIRLHGTLKIEIVVELFYGGIVGETVEELQAQAGFHSVRHRDSRRDLRAHLVLGCGRGTG